MLLFVCGTGSISFPQKGCCPRRKLDDGETLKRVRELFCFGQWSPEQIAARPKEEKNPISISYATLYRGISSGAFVCTYFKSVASSVQNGGLAACFGTCAASLCA